MRSGRPKRVVDEWMATLEVWIGVYRCLRPHWTKLKNQRLSLQRPAVAAAAAVAAAVAVAVAVAVLQQELRNPQKRVVDGWMATLEV